MFALGPVGSNPKRCRSAPAKLIALKLALAKVSYEADRPCMFDPTHPGPQADRLPHPMTMFGIPPAGQQAAGKNQTPRTWWPLPTLGGVPVASHQRNQRPSVQLSEKARAQVLNGLPSRWVGNGRPFA